jgi:hypothetical protein
MLTELVNILVLPHDDIYGPYMYDYMSYAICSVTGFATAYFYQQQILYLNQIQWHKRSRK